MKVKVGCGCYIGPPKWQRGFSDSAYEPNECCWEAVIEVDEQEWHEGDFGMNCPACGAYLDQEWGHFQELPNSIAHSCDCGMGDEQ